MLRSICFLAQFPPPIHGLSKAIDTLYNSQLKEKYRFSKIDITSNKKVLSNVIRLLKTKCELIYFTPSQTKWGNLRDLIFLKIIDIKREKCLVHIHGGYYRQLVDNDLPRWQRILNYRAMKRMAGGVVLGQSLHHIFEGMMDDTRIFICPNCVDNAYIADSIEDKCSDLKVCDTIHVLYLSNFIATKGYQEIAELAKMLQANGHQEKFKFHFAGKFFDPVEEQYFRNHIQGLENVVFYGVVQGSAKKELLKKCHVFSLLSRYPNEGQPISILEAMGNGMAIITTDHAGIPEIASALNGYICKKDSIKLDDIYEYLLSCYVNREALLNVCRNNWKKILENYTEKQYISNMDNIFEAVCKP